MLVRGVGGLFFKLLMTLCAAAMILLGLRWFRANEVERFCTSVPSGMTREEVRRRAEESHLRVRRGDTRDEITNPAWSSGLAWCYLEHDGTTVTSKRFAHE